MMFCMLTTFAFIKLIQTWSAEDTLLLMDLFNFDAQFLSDSSIDMCKSNIIIGMCNSMNVDAVKIHTTWDFEDYLNILHELLAKHN